MHSLENTVNTSPLPQLLIILAMVFAPFTQLRVGLVGFTELFLIILLFTVIGDRSNRINFIARNQYTFTKFWVVYIFFSLIGALFNSITFGYIKSITESLKFDLLAYVFTLIVCFSIETTIYNNRIDLWMTIKEIYVWLSAVLFFLYIFVGITGNLYGSELLYYGYFRPFANNIHHVAMVIAPLPFIGLKLFDRERKLSKKNACLLLIVSNFLVGYATGSTKIILGFIAASLFLVVIKILLSIKKIILKWVIVLLGVSTVMILIYLFQKDISDYIFGVFFAADMGGGREILWKSSISKILDSPIIGHGPGSHASYYSNGLSDAHQTFLTVGLQAGLPGLAVFSWLNIKIAKMIRLDAYYVSAYVAILVYALGGDLLRRIPMWIFLILLYYESISLRGRKTHE